MEADLRMFLGLQPTIAQLVGQRIFPRTAPQGAEFPRITYRVVSGSPVHSQTGRSGVTKFRVQIDCWATSMAEGWPVREAVRQSLDGFKGTVGATNFGGCFLLGEIDITEPPKAGEGVEIFHRAMDFEVWANEE